MKLKARMHKVSKHVSPVSAARVTAMAATAVTVRLVMHKLVMIKPSMRSLPSSRWKCNCQQKR